MADIERIKKEMESLTESNLVPVNKVERINNSDLEWKVVFDGPIASSYEDGIFLLKFIFPNDYPTHGPEAKFITPMFHPNVSSNQHVCINLLDEDKWDTKRTVEDIILGIIYLLVNPTYKGGYPNSKAYELLKEEKYDEYFDKVEEYAYKYATKEYEHFNDFSEFNIIF